MFGVALPLWTRMEAAILELDDGLCRVFGLTSDTGQLLNGRIARLITPPKQAANVVLDDRLAVQIDGEDSAKMLKRANLEFASVTKDATGAGSCFVTINLLGPSVMRYSSWGVGGVPAGIRTGSISGGC